MKSSRPILLVEDDVVDAMTVNRACTELKISNSVVHTVNGVEALGYLNEHKTHPCLILLDLNMPKMNGIEFLEKVKKSDGLKRIPVIVLTTSNGQKDKVESYKLGVAGYMLKPIDYQQFLHVMKEIDMYWTISQLPE